MAPCSAASLFTLLRAIDVFMMEKRNWMSIFVFFGEVLMREMLVFMVDWLKRWKAFLLRLTFFGFNNLTINSMNFWKNWHFEFFEKKSSLILLIKSFFLNFENSCKNFFSTKINIKWNFSKVSTTFFLLQMTKKLSRVFNDKRKSRSTSKSFHPFLFFSTHVHICRFFRYIIIILFLVFFIFFASVFCLHFTYIFRFFTEEKMELCFFSPSLITYSHIHHPT